MSLYYVQKFLFELNRDPKVQELYSQDPDAAYQGFDLTDEEKRALTEPDIGLLFVFGVNGQILMHFAAFHQIDWQDYLQQMRDGVDEHGEVRDGVYKVTGYQGVEAHASALGQESHLGEE